MKNTINVALFASGSGSNVENIVLYFKNHPRIKINQIFCNKPDAFVLKRAEKLGIASFIFNKNDFSNSNVVLDKLIELNTDFIVLAGFLWLTPSHIIQKYANKIINIHPALLPKYGGKGMYGSHVHQAVVENKDSESGITIHFVNEEYDKGKVIFQKSTKVLATDTAEIVAQKVHQLEYNFFPKVIEKTLLGVFD